MGKQWPSHTVECSSAFTRKEILAQVTAWIPGSTETESRWQGWGGEGVFNGDRTSGWEVREVLERVGVGGAKVN